MRTIFTALKLSLSLFLFSSIIHLRAHVLDNFDDNLKTGWSDFTFVSGVGLPVEKDGRFEFSLPPLGQAIFSASTKTSETFTLEDGKTVEFRVDLVSGNGKDSFGVLAFIPTTSSASTLAGYGFAKSTTDILVTKGIGKYFYNENPPDQLKNENVTMVLSLTGQGANVIVHTTLLDKDANNAVIFDKTFIDTPAAEILSDGTDDPAAPYLGAGNFVLYCYEDFDSKAPQDSYDVTFDNAETYVLENIVLDDFNDNTKTDWKDFSFVDGFGLPVEANGQFTFDLPPAGQALFVASTKMSRAFDLTEGNRVELSVDLIDGNGGDSFAVLAFIPTTSDVSSLSGYGLSKSTTDILVSKGINKYFYNENPAIPIKNDNVTMKLSLTVRNGNVSIEAQVLDKESNNAVLFDKTFLDTPQADVLSDGTDDPAVPYIGSGHFVLICYEAWDANAPQDDYKVTFDNARVAAPPVAANTPPVISDVSPETSSSFVAASSKISFKATDDKDLADNSISVVLDDQTFTTANGLTVTGTGNARTVTLGGLSAEHNYAATLKVVDSDSVSTSVSIFFDTFSKDDLIIEAEDYNFGSGQFIDNPSPIAEGSGPQPNSYANQAGVPEIDYQDTRTDFTDVLYRPDDHVRMQHSLDVSRQKFADAGGSASSVFDYDIADVAADEWLNYTRSFPAGSYEVYLREALVNGTQVQARLDEVTSDPSQEEQTTRALGTFQTATTGFQFRNILLEDATGQSKVLVRLSGKQTLRLTQVSSEPADGNIFQNYLIFVPVPNAPVQRASVTSVSPSDGVVVQTFLPKIAATILNRDTTVEVGTIQLFVNNVAVSATVTSNPDGADIAYPLPTLPDANSTISARLEFKDNEGTSITSQWSFTITYQALNATSRAPASGPSRGMTLRFVQAPAGSQLENSLLRAEDQLAPGSTVPKAIDVTSVVQVINFNENTGDAGSIPGDTIVPGLDPDNNGTDDFAVEINTWLDLPAGVQRFGVVSDDGYKISSPAKFGDASASPLAFHNGGPANETFEFLVPQAGIYPFRMVWYERGGGANAEWFSVNRETGDTTLINDPDSPNAIKAYVDIAAPTLQVQSATKVDGPYAADVSAVIDAGNQTITIPLANGNRFYRIGAATAKKITSSQISGQTLVLKFSEAPFR